MDHRTFHWIASLGLMGLQFGCMGKVTELEIDTGSILDSQEPQDTHPFSPADSGSAEEDKDGDGYGSNEDCDDENADVHPDANEVCDGIDNDCDALIDDEDDDLDPQSATAWYLDADGDGFGDASNSFLACIAPSGTVSDGTDCDDENAAIHPGAVELCNWIDDDCAGGVDDGLPDLDASGIEDCKEVALILSRGFQSHADEGNCDGMNYLEREVQEIESFLSDMGLTPILIRDNAESGVDHSAIAPYPVVLYHNGGWAESGSEELLEALSLAAIDGQALFFLGDDLGNHAYRTQNETELSTLFKLSSISEFFSNASGSEIRVEDSQHPVMTGKYGTVSAFEYYADVDHVSTPQNQEKVLMKTDIDSPAVFAAEIGTGQRTLSLIASIHNSHDCPIANSDGLAQLEVLFKNGISWLQGWQ